MDFGTAVKTGFRRYFDFEGRSRRSEYWWWILFIIVVNVVLGLFDDSLGGAMLSSLFSLAVFIPNIAVGVRRLHDTGRTGWWYLLWLLPIIGWIVMIYWMALEGDAGENEYGHDPVQMRD